MVPDGDAIHCALARVCNQEGATLGTGFFVLGAEGVALTCNHLIEGKEEVWLDCGDGRQRKGRAAPEEQFPEIDLAILRCADDPPNCALPIEPDHRNLTRFWSKGFHYYGRDITQAFPLQGNGIKLSEHRPA
ncbi:MAG: serine protease [Blastocatellia bacterium]